MDRYGALDAKRIRWSATAGVVGPVWFWLTLIALAVLHGRIDVSGHQLLRFGFLMYLALFGYGACTLVFIWGLRQRMPVRRTSNAVVIFWTLFAAGPLMATFTPSAGQGPPESWHGWLHFAGFLILTLAPIALLPLLGVAVWRDPRWRPLGPVSVGWGAVVAVVVFSPSSPGDGYALWSGPGSMIDIALIGGFQIVVSWRLTRLAAHTSTAPVPARGSAAENAVG